MDETGYFYRAIPGKTLTLKDHELGKLVKIAHDISWIMSAWNDFKPETISRKYFIRFGFCQLTVDVQWISLKVMTVDPIGINCVSCQCRKLFTS